MLLQSLIEASVSFSSNHEEQDVLPPRTRKSSRRNNEVCTPYQTRKSRRLHQSSVNNDGCRVLSVVLEEKLNRGSGGGGVDVSVLSFQKGNDVSSLPVECPIKLQRSSRHTIGLEPLASSIRHESSRPYPIHGSRRIKKNSIVILSEEPATDDEAEKACSKTHMGSETVYGGKVFPVISEENSDRGDCDIDGSVRKSLNGDVDPCLQVKCPDICIVNREQDFDGFSSLQSENKVASVLKSLNGDDGPCLQVKCPDICTVNCEQDFDSFSSLQSENKVASVCKSENGFDMFGLEGLDGDAPVKQLCISLLRSWGLVERNWPLSSAYISELSGTSSGRGEIQPCKICGQSENTMNMLLCDHCDEAFHLSCSNLKGKLLPTGEWFCSHCLGKKYEASTETYFLRSRGSITWENATAKSKFGPIAFGLRYPESHKSSVRIGERFQAEVPEWSIQNSNEADDFGEPLEMNPADTFSSLNGRLIKFPQASPYSNWLQCQETIHKDLRGCAERSICGKWRRAPFNEVQTGNWDCSCAVVWDPIHSDCAVPQELDTEEVLVHLKYINKMRSRLAAKRR